MMNRSTIISNKAKSASSRHSYSLLELMQIAKRMGAQPIVEKGGKRLRLITVNPSEVDGDNLPPALQQRIKTLNK